MDVDILWAKPWKTKETVYNASFCINRVKIRLCLCVTPNILLIYFSMKTIISFRNYKTINKKMIPKIMNK